MSLKSDSKPVLRRLSLLARPDAGAKFKRRIVRQYFVRFHMGLMVTATVTAGLIASKGLLEAGVHSVLIRYPLCVVAAYLVFIGLVKVWIGYVLIRQKSWLRSSVPNDPGIVDLPNVSLGNTSSAGTPQFAGFAGGESGGGGASDSWGAAVRPSASDAGTGGFGLPSLEDGIWIVVALAAVVLAIFGAGFYLVYVAPQMLPEIALNALLAPALKRAASKAESNGWLRSVVRSTWIPMVVVLLITIGLAVAVHHQCPTARKLMDVLNCPTEPC